jgi:hypothetical protein
MLLYFPFKRLPAVDGVPARVGGSVSIWHHERKALTIDLPGCVSSNVAILDLVSRSGEEIFDLFWCHAGATQCLVSSASHAREIIDSHILPYHFGLLVLGPRATGHLEFLLNYIHNYTLISITSRSDIAKYRVMYCPRCGRQEHKTHLNNTYSRSP